MQRALQGSGPGWRRLRTRKELVAFHEAGHAVVAAAMKFYVHRVFLVDVSEPGKTTGFAGACVSSFTPEDPLKDESPQCPTRMVRDARTAAELCWCLAENLTWKSALQQYRAGKAQARQIIERHWFAVIDLAEEIERRGDLNRAEVTGILAHNGL